MYVTFVTKDGLQAKEFVEACREGEKLPQELKRACLYYSITKLYELKDDLLETTIEIRTYRLLDYYSPVYGEV